MTAGPETTMSLNEAAEQLGVHYMTAYRYVRTGRLRADRVDGKWRIRGDDLRALVQREPAAPGAPIPLGERQARLHARLVVGDESGAWQVIEDALTSGLEPGQIHTELLLPVMARVGDESVVGRASVAGGHLAGVIAMRIVGRLGPRFARRGRTWGTVVLGMCAGDPHGLGCAVVADLLRGERFLVVDLGADTPAEAFVETALTADRLIAVLVGATVDGSDAVVGDTVRALVDAGCGAPVLVGGAAIRDQRHARVLGADGWTGDDADGAVQAVLATADDTEPISVGGRQSV